ncbi:SDR family oxidoreductase [Polaromonas sp. CG_9.11]|uniref:UDP-glucose 4-epimerase family protein n=1 Tax=Polaromonas sp. CG_9.11 TaxID=2787730 RepID=UPI0018CA3DE7|nr:SDR family oxidoreductase [Polaromonas sp. CG_9.11]MBG6074699.1 nucleoside-diphosphate-sugar epimerase [Polaromonas sp. CG_9.11]
MNPVLVTGAGGFVGRALCADLVSRGAAVRGTGRSVRKVSAVVETAVVKSIDENTHWRGVLAGCDAVVHLAARVHVVQEAAAHPLAEFRRVNTQGTLNLARQAAAAGVRRFVFISSIGVNGAETFQQPYAALDRASPHSPYAVSKYEAELSLREISLQTGLEVVIIRPPLVYGPSAPGNFGSLMRWLQLGIPLPLGAIRNQRSLVALDNLVDLIVTCITHPAAANQTFLVSDGEDVSTTELLRRMGQAMGCPARLLPVPTGVLKAAAALLGKRDLAQRLCGSLQVDIQKTRQLLGWNPPLTLDQGLKKAAQGFRP